APSLVVLPPPGSPALRPPPVPYTTLFRSVGGHGDHHVHRHVPVPDRLIGVGHRGAEDYVEERRQHADEEHGDEVAGDPTQISRRSEEHTSELQSRFDLVCRLLLEKKNKWN